MKGKCHSLDVKWLAMFHTPEWWKHDTYTMCVCILCTYFSTCVVCCGVCSYTCRCIYICVCIVCIYVIHVCIMNNVAIPLFEWLTVLLDYCHAYSSPCFKCLNCKIIQNNNKLIICKVICILHQCTMVMNVFHYNYGC